MAMLICDRWQSIDKVSGVEVAILHDLDGVR